MPLATGTRLGPYQINSPLGAGGMGEVYRAQDTRLGRSVAIKILPDKFARDAQRMARFDREAKLLASLNHPNIGAIYGLEESTGLRALVMELVEGPTLADRIRQGPLPLDEAAQIARQIAEALEYAHERSVIHRDLKPSNIKITRDGEAKVLDFGLAKALEDDSSVADIANSPTLSQAATQSGILLGTAAYMSPEQARGKTADRRADIWSFGVVLYDMLTGKPAFQGETISDTLAAVIRAEPDWSALPARTPEPIRRLLRRCLEKDPKRRLRDIGEARVLLEDFIAGPQPAADAYSASAIPAPIWRRDGPWVVAAVLAFALAVSLLRPWQSAREPPGPLRLTAEIGADASLEIEFGPAALLSPDGTRLIFVARGADQKQRIYLRSLDQLQAAPLSATEGAQDPFFSPDGQWIAFFADGMLKKISAQGGAAVTLCAAPRDRGGTWSGDGTIFFAPEVRVGLSKVSSAGGTPEPFTTLDKQAGEVTHRWPQVLPGGNAVLFTASTNGLFYENADLVVYSLTTAQRKTVLRGGSYGRWLPSGHLAYVHEHTLFAVPFDLKRLEVTGQPVPILEGVASDASHGGAQFSASESGTLVYVGGSPLTSALVSVYWMDAGRKFQPRRDVPGAYSNPAFSPDGKRLALEIGNAGRSDLWVYDWERDTLTRLTFIGTNFQPVWTPDGQQITFASEEKNGSSNIFWKRADDTGEAQRLTEGNGQKIPDSWRPDGKVLAFSQRNPGTRWDLMTMEVEGDQKSGWKAAEPKPFVNTPFDEDAAVFSPDGRWIAYQSNESGDFEVYVRPFPGPGGKWQVSNGGGRYPRWSRNGKELFYSTHDNKIMVVTYTTSHDSFRADKPRLWSPGQFTYVGGESNYDLHPDGKRFAVLKAPNGNAQPVVNKVSFIFNFFDELRRKVPTQK